MFIQAFVEIHILHVLQIDSSMATSLDYQFSVWFGYIVGKWDLTQLTFEK